MGPAEMRVCFVLPGASLTGGIVLAAETARELSKLGHNVVLVHTGWRSEGTWMPAEISIRRPTIFGRLLRRALMQGAPSLSWVDHANQSLLMRALAAVDPEVYIATSGTTVLPAVAAAQTKPVVQYLMHDELLVNANDPVKVSIAAGARAIVQHFWANSSWLADRVLAATGRRPDLVFPGVDGRLFNPGSRRLETGTTPLRVATLVKDLPEKGFDVLLKAFALVAEQRELLWIGFGSAPRAPSRAYPCRFEYHANPHGDALASIYRDADVFVSASLLESFPLPPLEAMACGTPVVTTRSGTEDYATDGVNALVVTEGNATALASAVQVLGDDRQLWERLRAGGLATASAFTWAHTGARAEKLLLDLLGTEKA